MLINKRKKQRVMKINYKTSVAFTSEMFGLQSVSHVKVASSFFKRYPNGE